MNYAQAVARIRVLETKLVNRNQIERILDSKSPQAFFEVLSDSAYSDHFETTNDPYKFQVVLDAELVRTKEFLVNNAPNPEQLAWIWHQYDLTNIKYLLKAKLAGKQVEAASLSKLGNVTPEIIVSAVEKDNTESLPEWLREPIREALGEYTKTNDPKSIDQLLDQAYFAWIANTYEQLKSPVIKKYITDLIDLYNIKLILRHKHQDTPSSEFEKYIVEQCRSKTIAKIDILGAYKDDLSNLQNNTKFFAYKKVIQPAVEHYKSNNSFLLFEKLQYDYLIDQLRYAKYQPFGIEPLVGYFLAKDNETKMLRIIMTAKLNNVELHQIHQLMRKLYLER